MDVVLVPGFWLGAWSWDAVLPALLEAGHRPFPLTLPGLENRDTERSGITLRDHVDAVVAQLDALPGPNALIGHSGGGAIIHAAVDARPERVARAIYVDSGPLGDGAAINAELKTTNGEIPLPAWSEFSEDDLRDLGESLRATFRERAVPQPARVATDLQRLSDPRRYDVPVTIITCEFPSAVIKEWLAQGHPYVAELARIRGVEFVDLPTGHWPQFTRPVELGEAIVAALAVG